MKSNYWVYMSTRYGFRVKEMSFEGKENGIFSKMKRKISRFINKRTK